MSAGLVSLLMRSIFAEKFRPHAAINRPNDALFGKLITCRLRE
jgi:hypothetical protein